MLHLAKGMVSGLLSLALILWAADAAAQESRQPPPPQLIYQTTHGLDVHNNAIDRLIHVFGFGCVRLRTVSIRCRIEIELETLLKHLVPSRSGIAHELTQLGGDCIDERAQLKCIYERHAERAGWIVGRSEPMAITDNFFRILIKVSGEDGSLRFETLFDRIEVTIGDFNGDAISDILFRNESDGDFSFNQMNSSGTVEGWHGLGGSSTDYNVVAVGDYNGDGTSDILFRDSATGLIGYYEIDDGTVAGWRGLAGASNDYRVIC
ncbi:MAG: VCBS repeat-containing protein [Hyphomicrobiales bacterium]|nr:VCBS repeat-containing protein [Hyphomicrobiales bacterium]